MSAIDQLPPWKIYLSAAEEAARQGNSENADELYDRAINVAQESLGATNKEFGVILSSIADTYVKRGNYDKAQDLYSKAVFVYESSFGSGHPIVALALRNLAEVYADMGMHEQAERERRRVTDILKEYLI
jgi:tetratricopeptide (TPR) repeat protein